jgi:hypothetical protein
MKTNKWKIAFWCCLPVTIIFGILALAFFYLLLDQSVTLDHQKIGYCDTNNDLQKLMTIINETDLSKSQIETLLVSDSTLFFSQFKKDTVQLNRVNLVFKSEKLSEVYLRW